MRMWAAIHNLIKIRFRLNALHSTTAKVDRVGLIKTEDMKDNPKKKPKKKIRAGKKDGFYVNQFGTDNPVQ